MTDTNSSRSRQNPCHAAVDAAAAERADGFPGRPVGDLVLRRRKEPMRVLRPLTPEDRAHPHAAGYFAAFAKLEAGDSGALAAFTALIGEEPKDALAQDHLKRLLNGGGTTRIEMAEIRGGGR